MDIIDISWPITTDTVEYKNRKTLEFTPLKTFEVDKVRDSIVTLGTHLGTHVDAPAHFLEYGKTIDQVSLYNLVGPCRVLDCIDVVESISEEFLEKFSPQKGEVLLLKTKNSALQASGSFHAPFVYLDESGAKLLASVGVRAVGTDYLGIERNQPTHPTHTILFEHDISIIEGLRLNHVQAGEYFFVRLPLSLAGFDAAPARAILLRF